MLTPLPVAPDVEPDTMGSLIPQVLVVVAVVVTLYWAIFLPNPGALEKPDAVMRIVVRVLAVVTMLVLAAIVFIQTWN